MTKPLSDDEFVDQVERSLKHWRARHTAWEQAVDDLRIASGHPAVQPTFDGNGTLTALDIEPAALMDYTNIELEQIITDAIRGCRTELFTAMQDLFAVYLTPGHPKFDPDVLGEPLVMPPQ